MIVARPDVAEKLGAWYLSWCSRITPSDSFLQVLGLLHAALIDRDGKGTDGVLADGLVANGRVFRPGAVIFAADHYASTSTEFQAGGWEP